MIIKPYDLLIMMILPRAITRLRVDKCAGFDTRRNVTCLKQVIIIIILILLFFHSNLNDINYLAEQSGELFIGDAILKVNDIDITQLTHDQVFIIF